MPNTENSIIRILLADDHKVLLDGLKLVLSRFPRIEVVGVAENGHEVIEMLQKKPVDVLVLDIQMPQMDGFETARYVRKHFPEVKILALSMHNDKPFIERMYQEGASGYLLKTATTDEILKAIEWVNSGELHFSPDVMKAVLEANPIGTQPSSQGGGQLTRRERQVIALIAKEYSNQEIAERLELSVETINTYRKNMLKKLGVKNTAGLVRYAISEGLVDQ